MNEMNAYKIIKNIVDNGGKKNSAASKLGCSRRTIDRYIAGYKAEGKAFFIHGNKGHKPTIALSDEMKADIVNLYVNKYDGANFAHFAELLNEKENITVSESTVRNIFTSAQIISPKANRKTRREFNAKLRKQLSDAKTIKEKERIKTKIINAEDAHPRRPRCSKFGEMIQIDASLHYWINDTKWTLHIAIDDATGVVVGAWFDNQETLKGYYHVFKQILTTYGIPFMFYSDRRSVFEYNRSGNQDASNDSFTQFSYACMQLGVDIKTTSIPQAKGRVERLIQSMQSRLPTVLRLEGVTTIEQANEYLPDFIAHYNAKFALNVNHTTSVFDSPPSESKINLTLAVISQRVVDSGHSIRFENRYYRTLNSASNPVFFTKGTKGLVIRTFNDELFFSCDDGVFALDEIPSHERFSKNFDFIKPVPVPSVKYVPKQNHPWRLATFVAFNKKQLSLNSVGS